MVIETESGAMDKWTFNIFTLEASVLNCNLLWECVFHFFQVLGLPLAVPLYMLWALYILNCCTPLRKCAPGETKHWLVTLQEALEDCGQRVRHSLCKVLILVLSSSVVSSSIEVSMMIVLAAFFVVQCDSNWSKSVAITNESAHKVTWQDMSHLWSRAASNQVTLVMLHSDIVNYAFHYGTILSRVLMDLFIARLTINSHEHGVRVLLLVRVISFAYFLKLWKAPFHFLFNYNRASVFLNAWVGISDGSIESLWKALKQAIPYVTMPQDIYYWTKDSLAAAPAFLWYLASFMADLETSTATAVLNATAIAFEAQVTNITTIIRTHIVMFCILCLWILWISAPRENEKARQLFCGYIFNRKLPGLLSAGNTRYLHFICVTVSGLVYYQSWGLNRARDNQSRTPQSFL